MYGKLNYRLKVCLFRRVKKETSYCRCQLLRKVKKRAAGGLVCNTCLHVCCWWGGQDGGKVRVKNWSQLIKEVHLYFFLSKLWVHSTGQLLLIFHYWMNKDTISSVPRQNFKDFLFRKKGLWDYSVNFQDAWMPMSAKDDSFFGLALPVLMTQWMLVFLKNKWIITTTSGVVS